MMNWDGPGRILYASPIFTNLVPTVGFTTINLWLEDEVVGFEPDEDFFPEE